MAGSVEVTSAGERLLHHDLQQAPAPLAPVVEPRGERGSSGEILSVWEEEEDSGRAPAPPPVTSSGPADGRREQAQGSLDVDGGGGRSRSTNLRNVAWANNPNCAKWVYAVLFLGGIVMAMISRDAVLCAFSHQEQVDGYNTDRYRLGAESALRVSLAFFVFFTIMFVTTVFTKKVHDRRNLWNSNLGWALFVKILMVAGCLFGVQFIPSWFIEFYGSVARFGAWYPHPYIWKICILVLLFQSLTRLFLAIQLISVTRLIMSWNNWHQLNPKKWRWLVRAISILLNFGSFGFIFWLLYQHRSNKVDFTIVIITLVLIVLMICIYLKSEVTAGWLAHGVMIAYIVFMCWTVIKSEPHRQFTKAKHPKGADWLTIVSFVFVVIVTAYSTLSTGEDHDWLQFNEEVPSEDDIPYGFGHFHLVFALGSMYFGMLLVGWNAYQTLQRWTTDFGWWSAVVRAVNGLLAAVLYIWMLRTPFIWNKRKLVLSCSRASWVPHVTFL